MSTSDDHDTPRERLEATLKTPYPADGEIWSAIIEAFAQEFEEIEEARREVFESRFVDNADGGALNRLGELFQTDRRTSEPTGEYRARLKTALRSQLGSGTLEDITESTAVMMQIDEEEINVAEPADEEAFFRTRIPADVLHESDISRELLPDLLNDISAAGVTGESVSWTKLDDGSILALGRSVEHEQLVDDGFSSPAVKPLSEAPDPETNVLATGVVIASGDPVENRTIGPTTGTVVAYGFDVVSETTADDGMSSENIDPLSEGED